MHRYSIMERLIISLLSLIINLIHGSVAGATATHLSLISACYHLDDALNKAMRSQLAI